jgi:adenosine deaminase CECR1
MLSKGIQATINSDDPGFFGYEGVTMDYVYAMVAWDLELIDLKKLSLNGITYSAVDDKVKKNLKEEVFPKKWKEFIDLVNSYE